MAYLSSWGAWEREKLNSDGTLKPGCREALRQKGWSEKEIATIERHHVSEVEVAKLMQAYEEDCHRRRAEDEERLRKKREEAIGSSKTLRPPARRIGNPIDTASMTPAQLRRFRRAGLDTEELLSQGFVEADEL